MEETVDKAARASPNFVLVGARQGVLESGEEGRLRMIGTR